MKFTVQKFNFNGLFLTVFIICIVHYTRHMDVLIQLANNSVQMKSPIFQVCRCRPGSLFNSTVLILILLNYCAYCIRKSCSETGRRWLMSWRVVQFSANLCQLKKSNFLEKKSGRYIWCEIRIVFKSLRLFPLTCILPKATVFPKWLLVIQTEIYIQFIGARYNNLI